MKKRELSRDLFRDKATAGDAVISTQVLQEFYVAATVKLRVDPLLVKSIIHMFENIEVVVVGKDLISEAVDTSRQYKLSFRDSLIVVSAESAKCDLLYTEDLNAGQIIRSVKIVNPLK